MRTFRPIPSLLAALVLLVAAAAVPAATYEVGSGKPYATLAALPTLAPGDLVLVSSGTYNEVKRWRNSGTAAQPITIRGVGPTRPIIDATGKNVSGALPNPRAVFQIEASHVIIERFELRNARNDDNGAGVRVCTFGAIVTDVVVRDLYIHHNDMGIMSGQCDRVLIEHCDIGFNGELAGNGYSHNMYLGGGATTIRGCHIHDAIVGQNVKSRGHYTELLYNWIADSQDGEVGLVDDAETAAADSNALLVGNVIISKNRGAGWNSGKFIAFGHDMGGAHPGTLYAYGNTCIAGTGSIVFLNGNRAESGVVASGNIFLGSVHIADASIGPVSGTANWLPTGAIVPAGFTASVQGSAPGFVNAAARDYRLTAASACRGAGAAGTYRDGGGTVRTATPAWEWFGLGDLRVRPNDGDLDIGAYEYASGAGTTSGTTTSGTTTTGTTTSGTSTSGTSTSGTSTSGTSTTGASGSATSGGATMGSPGGGSSRSGCGIGSLLGVLLAFGFARRRRR